MFWLDNPEIIFDKDEMMEFFPMANQKYDNRLNALFRLSIYISIFLVVYHKKLEWVWIAIFTGIFTILLRRGRRNKNSKEQFDDEIENESENENEAIDSRMIGCMVVEKMNDDIPKCTKPTIDNPFMNVTMKDYLNVDEKTNKIIDRPPACDTSNPDVKKEIDNNFNNNLFKDIDDIFGKMNSQRQFYTMPSTTIPNNQDAFAKWLYLSPKTCKEDQDYCLRYEDVRGKRFDFPEPLKNPISSQKDY